MGACGRGVSLHNALTPVMMGGAGPRRPKRTNDRPQWTVPSPPPSLLHGHRPTSPPPGPTPRRAGQPPPLAHRPGGSAMPRAQKTAPGVIRHTPLTSYPARWGRISTTGVRSLAGFPLFLTIPSLANRCRSVLGPQGSNSGRPGNHRQPRHPPGTRFFWGQFPKSSPPHSSPTSKCSPGLTPKCPQRIRPDTNPPPLAARHPPSPRRSEHYLCPPHFFDWNGQKCAQKGSGAPE